MFFITTMICMSVLSRLFNTRNASIKIHKNYILRNRNSLQSPSLLANARKFSSCAVLFHEKIESESPDKIDFNNILKNHESTRLNQQDLEVSDPVGFVASYIKFFESISGSATVLESMTYLRSFHDATGLPWWGSIIVSTVLLRTAITFPLAVYQQYIMAKLQLLKEEMMQSMRIIAQKTKDAKIKNNWDEKFAQQVFKLSNREKWRFLIERDNCHPAKGVILVLGQVPLWVTLSFSYRNLCTAKPHRDVVAEWTFHELLTEGTFWCPQLTHPDPLIALPLLMAITNLLICEVHALQKDATDDTKTQKLSTNFFRLVAVMTFPIAIFMPSGVVLYWVTSSGCALFQVLLLLHPGLRGALRIPVTPSTHLNPYSRMSRILKERADKLVKRIRRDQS